MNGDNASDGGVWKRLVGWMRGDPAKAPRTSSPEEEADEPVLLQPEEEVWLRTLITAVASGKRTHEVGGSEFWDNVHSMWSRGHERLATEWVEKCIATPTTPDSALMGLRDELVKMLDRRGESGRAVPHLEALSESPDHALEAHYMLAEHYRRRGDEARALRHYEAVLARDMDYPNVRVRVDGLRRARGLAAPAAVGETVAGAGTVGVADGARYQLLRELGRGATGIVYQARDFELERDVAVKLLHPHLAAVKRIGACARFFEEARIAASLRHPNIIAVLDLDERARRIVMELAAGGTLRQVLNERGPRTIRRALERHTQILSALAAAHRRGVVHRDLKPGNLMFRRDPDAPGAEIVLGDFGVAHLPNERGELGAAAAEDRRPAEAIGTLAYMSPEQRAGTWIDARADLYSAAIVLFEMLTSELPWPRERLLAGTRQAGDLTVPQDAMSRIPDELRGPLQTHMDALGDPDRDGRPTTEEALVQARSLRDLAIARAS